jgi:hypothetical protein
MLPFNVEQFLNVFAKYNQAIWPTQVVIVVTALAAVFLALKRSSLSSQVITVLLACLWLWMGIAYHLAFFTRINQAAYAFAALFIVQAALFLYAGIVNRNMTFRVRWNTAGIVGGLFIIYSLLIYPAAGFFSGHSYPYSPTFGAPCPTTIFTFGLLLWADRKVPRYVIWIPLLWSLIGMFAAVYLGIWEDAGLPVAGITGTILILSRHRRTVSPIREGLLQAPEQASHPIKGASIDSLCECITISCVDRGAIVSMSPRARDCSAS